MKVTGDVKNAQATEETRGSDMVAEGMMEVHGKMTIVNARESIRVTGGNITWIYPGRND